MAVDTTIEIIIEDKAEIKVNDHHTNPMVNSFLLLFTIKRLLTTYAFTLAEPTTSSNETRAVQLLRRIFNDDDDSLFSHRIGNANQLLKMLEESRSTVSDSLEFRQEQKQLLDICVYDEGLRRIVEFTKAPPALRNTMLKIVSGLACYTRLDLALSWIFDRLSVWETSVNNANKDREWKKWLLRLLKQASERSEALEKEGCFNHAGTKCRS